MMCVVSKQSGVVGRYLYKMAYMYLQHVAYFWKSFVDPEWTPYFLMNIRLL